MRTKKTGFSLNNKKIGRFNLSDKTLLLPEMGRISTRMVASALKGFGIGAKVMETCKGIELGKKYTSGKECYPCQVTTGDILYFMKNEMSKENFDIGRYLYLMPEAAGPCRFGMYNKYQRTVLDSFPELEKLKIVSLSADDSYSFDGMIGKKKVKDLRKVAFVAVVAADILERLAMRIRPYEKESGMADIFIEEASDLMGKVFETYASKKKINSIFCSLEKIVKEGKAILDPSIPPKPLIGIVGEIYMRNHSEANQNLIKVLERQGAEAVNASIAEWINFTVYKEFRDAKKRLRLSLRTFKRKNVLKQLKKIVDFQTTLFYQKYRQSQIYRRTRNILDLAQDHDIKELENIVNKRELFSFDIGTEACLSIPGVLSYARNGFNGVVNVYPFTCMPSTISSAIVKPVISRMHVPYLDVSYDSSFQPGRETAIRTFTYQAEQHFKRHGRP